MIITKSMKMAKATDAEWKSCFDFATALDEKVNTINDAELGRWVRDNYVWFGRVLYGYRILVDNACDPTQDTLEWKPEIAAAIAAHSAKPEYPPLPD